MSEGQVQCVALKEQGALVTLTRIMAARKPEAFEKKEI